MGALITIWRWRFTILLALTVAAGGWMLWRMDRLKVDAAEAWKAAQLAEQINAENARQFSALQAEKAAAEKLLSERLAKKTADARRLNALVDAIQAAEPSNACSASRPVRAAIDGLRAKGETGAGQDASGPAAGTVVRQIP